MDHVIHYNLSWGVSSFHLMEFDLVQSTGREPDTGGTHSVPAGIPSLFRDSHFAAGPLRRATSRKDAQQDELETWLGSLRIDRT